MVRRINGDLIDTLGFRNKYEIVISDVLILPVCFLKVKPKVSALFTFTENNQLRGHNLKLNKPCANKSIKLHSFSLRNIPVWNSLPLEVVNSRTVVEFKTELDKLWRSQRFDQTNIF